MDFQLTHDDQGRLVMTAADGTKHAGVVPVRCFPITDPDHWISLCDADGREQASIADLQRLPGAVRKVLETELSRREFVPVIERIVQVSSGADPTMWTVETDRGPTRFLVKSEEDVRRLGAGGAIIVDIHAVRYVVPDIRALDGTSRRWLERYL